MAETMRYISECLAGFPDNVSELIRPENMRDYVVSAHDGGGSLISEDTASIPITSGVPVLINPLVAGPHAFGVFWTFDGNSLAVSNYAAALPSTIIPSPFYKAATIRCDMELNKTAGGTDSYDFHLVKNGVAFGLPTVVRYDTSEAKHVHLEWFLNADISAPDTYGVQVTGLGTGDDLTMSYFSFLVQDTANWEAP